MVYALGVVSGVEPTDDSNETVKSISPFRAVRSTTANAVLSLSRGNRLAVFAGSTERAAPKRVAPSSLSRTPYDSKGLKRGRAEPNRYTVRRKARVQFPNNPWDWLNQHVRGLARASMLMRYGAGKPLSLPFLG